MQTISLFNAKTHLSRVVEELVNGVEEEIIISRHGKPMVRVTAIHPNEVSLRIGIARGKFVVSDEFDAVNPEIERLFAAERGVHYAPAS